MQGYTNGYNGFRPRIVCQICEKPGHSAQTCWHLGKIQGYGSSSSVPECQLCGLTGHTAAHCDQRESFASLQGQHTAMTSFVQHNSSAPNHKVWITDSGASSHMTSDIHTLNNVTSYTDGDQVQVGNGAGLSIKHIGDGLFF
ncbi:putative transcription factor interactor and regulator CCHC(Zn) family [Rosa chinensis]|uniref:Putative transcription factor interactor and regulator CCHC(Zn) family n=1 Tax=Rosa chinensis TaxID=74649 RepID=A0A2P6PCR8_ROSCH|nr:putative transcription factor interactor and regulator CCHC(Zn) family [Rosa chinensis]